MVHRPARLGRLWLACALGCLCRPASLPEEWDDDAALVRSNADGFRSRYSHLVRNVELWLPASFDFTFEEPEIDGRRIIVGSSAVLRRQLGELNDATWRMDADDKTVLARQPPSGRPSLEAIARHAMSVMSRLVQHAAERRLPMKLDYRCPADD